MHVLIHRETTNRPLFRFPGLPIPSTACAAAHQAQAGYKQHVHVCPFHRGKYLFFFRKEKMAWWGADCSNGCGFANGTAGAVGRVLEGFLQNGSGAPGSNSSGVYEKPEFIASVSMTGLLLVVIFVAHFRACR